MEVYLDHLKGERAGALDRFSKDVIRVGRNAEFELCFDDLGVSYEHAELRVRDGDFWLVDRGSTNGSYVNEERAYNARLKDGDVLRFGKKGPVLRFRLTAAAGASSEGEAAAGSPPFDLQNASELIKAAGRPKTDEPLSDVPPLAPAEALAPTPPGTSKKARSRRNTIPNLPSLEPDPRALAGAPAQPPRPTDMQVEPVPESSSSAGGGSSDLSSGGSSALDARRAGERRIAVTQRPARGFYVLLGALLLLTVFSGSAAVMFWMEASRTQHERDDADRRCQLAKAELEELKKQTDDQRREEQLAALRNKDDTRQLIERLEQSIEHERKQYKQLDRESRQKIEDLQQQLARANGELAQLSAMRASPNDTRAWKVIQNRVKRSVVLVGCSFKLKKKDGTSQPYTGFGSGFFVSKDGLIVTNKHVIEPWKFRDLALKIAQEDLEPDMSTYQVAVWIAETRFFSGQRFELSTGYSTTMKTLERVRTARDTMVTMANPGSTGPRNLMIHDGSNEDLALLKASGGPFDWIPLRRASDGPIEKLDQVMLLGFPAGPAVLERGVAETSPALGQVRKVEDTICINASMMPGNSGGPLLDTEGRVVGVASRVVVVGAESLGICIKSEHVASLMDGGSW